MTENISIINCKWYLVGEPWQTKRAIYTDPDPNAGICVTDGENLEHSKNWCNIEIEEYIEDILEHIVEIHNEWLEKQIPQEQLKDKVEMTFEGI